MQDVPNPADAELTTSKPHRPKRRRHVLVLALITFTAVLMLVTALSTWAKRQILDTDAWVATTNDLLADPTVRAGLSQFAVDQIYSSVDVAGQLQQQLPDNLKGLAGPVAGALRQPATQGVDYLLGTSRARSLWETINRRAHETIIRILENRTRAGLSTANGTVTLDISELVRQVGSGLGLPTAVLDRIPADAGQITLLHSDELATAQKAVSVLRWLGPVLFVVVVLLFALAIGLATGWRRVALRDVGIAVLLVGLLLAIVQRLVGNYIVSSIVQLPSNRPTVAAIWGVGTQLLREIARNSLAIGIVLILVAALAGPTRLAHAARRALLPLATARPALVWIVAAVVFGVILVWEPIPSLGTWYGALILAVAIAVGLVALRRQLAREAASGELTPYARPTFQVPTWLHRSPSTAPVAPAWAAPGVGALAVAPAGFGWAPPSAPAGTPAPAGPVVPAPVPAGLAPPGRGPLPPPPAAVGSPSSIDQLERLHHLHEVGALTDEEYRAAKAGVLGL